MCCYRKITCRVIQGDETSVSLFRPLYASVKNWCRQFVWLLKFCWSAKSLETILRLQQLKVQQEWFLSQNIAQRVETDNTCSVLVYQLSLATWKVQTFLIKSHFFQDSLLGASHRRALCLVNVPVITIIHINFAQSVIWFGLACYGIPSLHTDVSRTAPVSFHRSYKENLNKCTNSLAPAWIQM